jgi:hypothetical protein
LPWKLAEYKTLFFFEEKQGLKKVIHYISHMAGIVLKFDIKQIPYPLFTSQDASGDYQGEVKVNFRKIRRLTKRYRQFSVDAAEYLVF